MANRIDAAELERLLADDNVPDEEIAKYVKPINLRSQPFEPVLTFNPATVEQPATRSILSLTAGALSARSNRRRQTAFMQRTDAGWKGLKILAQGDSWFQYPILLRDVVDNLSQWYAVYSQAIAGDTLANMVGSAQQVEQLIERHKFDAMVFSAGGNDLVGDPLPTYLRQRTPASRVPGDYITEAFDAFLAETRGRFEPFAAKLLNRFPQLHMFCHGYDWPIPQPQGIWLRPAFAARSIPEQMQPQILHLMLDRYYEMLHAVAAKIGDRLHVVDCRGAVGAGDQWFDELHPFNVGFAKAAGKFKAEINRVFPSAERGLSEAVRLSWSPVEERSGVRTRVRIVPVGAVVTIGRGSDREILLDDDRVSRNHAKLTIGGGEIRVDDLDSTNGTFLDGTRIRQAGWHPGQRLRIGHFNFSYDIVVDQLDTTMPEPPKPRDPPVVGQPVPAKVLLRPIRIELCNASVASHPSPALALGVFQNVSPTASRGAAHAVDMAFDRVISSLLECEMIDGRPGRITPLDAPAKRGIAQQILLTGLGMVGEFAPQVLVVVGENLATKAVTAKLPQLATVPMGANSGLALKGCVEGLLIGLLSGLRKDDKQQSFERLSICETNPKQFEALVQAVSELKESGFFAEYGFEPAVERSGAALDTSGTSRDGNGGQRRHASPCILDVRSQADGAFEFRIYSGDNTAGIFPRTQVIAADKRTAVMKEAELKNFDVTFGQQLAGIFVPSEVQEMIALALKDEGGQLVVTHDSASSQIPWEAIYFGSSNPALECGVSRRLCVMSDGPIKRRPPQNTDAALRMLVIQNPTSDPNLAGAQVEAEELCALFKANGGDVTILSNGQATRAAVLEQLNTGRYDILHHAGHAVFFEGRPQESGIVLAERVMLTAADLAKTAEVPHLIFLNACQSGRVRDATVAIAGDLEMVQVATHTSLAGEFIRRGVGHLIGTYWKVNDDAARNFALTLYAGLLNGDPIGPAIKSARLEVAKKSKRDWANYLHFGDYYHALRKMPEGAAAPAISRGASGTKLEAVEPAGPPDPLAGEAPPRGAGDGAVGTMERSGSDLPISRDQAGRVSRWMKANFGDALKAAVQGSPFTVEHLCAIACQETAYFWSGLIDKTPAPIILQRCVLDASGDFPGTDRSAFPRNTADFRNRFGAEFTAVLVDEANKTRSMRNYGAKDWVYKGYGIFQYDLQYVTVDGSFFRNKEWYEFDACLAKAMGELQKKFAQTGDVHKAIQAYNGSGRRAVVYAENVAQFTQWCQDSALV